MKSKTTFAPHDAHNKYPQIFEIMTKDFLFNASKVVKR